MHCVHCLPRCTMTKTKKDFKDPNTGKKALTNFLAGAVGGAGSASLSHPLDSVKVKMQTFPTMYRGGLHCMQEVVRQDGIRGLYRGLTPGVTLSMTEASIRYMIYGVCQDLVRKVLHKGCSETMSVSHNAAAGGLTGFFATFAACPIEVVKCRMQGSLEMKGQSHMKSKGPIGVLGYTLKNEGITGLYRGFTSNVARNVPGELVFFATYEQMRKVMKKPGQVKDDLGALKSFMCGSSAGIAYWVSIYPLDSVKSRVQVLSAEGQVQGLAKTFVNILRTEGIRPLYHGVGYSIPRAIIGSGSHFVFYETARKILLRKEREERERNAD
ncbi:hypothetical protein CAPTEDRAFT_168388 [Capitella teleta]|uniref:Mitochondrial carrier protein n=1 Tax=Capitella teleta TaxID=283909 RepID=R7TEE1_CAPTE|nr:hypothetical protein CAPTEDRAFT_168388 [Capitella teleta]|eukprot:ELT92099.1 hypothetical protein CAPTEDRAFT_168388 [Capitella teleta]